MNISPQIEAAAASTRSESEVRQQRSLSMLDVIRSAVRIEAKTCPWCGADAPLAAQVCGRFVIECETEGCDTSKYGDTLTEVWAAWNKRS